MAQVELSLAEVFAPALPHAATRPRFAEIERAPKGLTPHPALRATFSAEGRREGEAHHGA